MIGRLGDDLSIGEERVATRDAVLTVLGSLEEELGSFDGIIAVSKRFGMVRATPILSITLGLSMEHLISLLRSLVLRLAPVLVLL